MTAAAADTNTKYMPEGQEIELRLAASKTIYSGTMVCRNASGLAVPAADTAGLKLAGVSKGDKRNGTATIVSGSSTPYFYAAIKRKGCFRFAASGLAITDIGKKVYVSDDKTITTTPTNVFAGYLMDIDTASWGWVDIGEATHLELGAEDDANIEMVGVAASKTIVVNTLVCLDADGYLVAAADATAVSFWGLALEGGVNAGADGAIDVAVQREGLATVIAAGLAVTDAGKEVWHSATSNTVTVTPGTILCGILNRYISAISCEIKFVRLPIVGQRANRQFQMPFSVNGATLNNTKGFEDRELPRRYICLSMFLDAETAPGGTDVLTATLSDGTTTFVATITGSATHGELKTAQVLTTATMKAATDTDVTLTDTSTTTADVKGVIICEAL
jgi:hypothetical protein